MVKERRNSNEFKFSHRQILKLYESSSSGGAGGWVSQTNVRLGTPVELGGKKGAKEETVGARGAEETVFRGMGRERIEA